MKTDTRDKILGHIRTHKQARVHDLARSFKLSRVAIHRQLKLLLKENEIKKVGKPPLVFYIPATKYASTTKINISKIKNKALPILKKAGVTRSSVFGSYVRGEQREDSDIDILVEVPNGTGLFEFADLKLELENALGKDVDLVTYNSIHPKLKEHILQEQIQIL